MLKHLSLFLRKPIRSPGSEIMIIKNSKMRINFLKMTLILLVMSALTVSLFISPCPLWAKGDKKQEKTEEKDPKAHSEKLVEKSMVLMEEREYDKAAALLNKALKLNPRNEDAWLLKGEIYTVKDKLQYALGTYRKALAKLPKSEALWFKFGYSLGKSGRYRDSLKCFNYAIKYDPNFANAYKYKGYALVKLYRFEEAIKCFQKTLAINPDDSRAKLFLGLAIYENGDEENGMKFIQQAFNKNPGLKNEMPGDLKKMLGI